MMSWRVGFSSLAQGVSSLSGPILLATLGMGALVFGIIDAWNGWKRMVLNAMGRIHPEEATYIPQHKARLALFFAAMRHFRAELEESHQTFPK